jgi:transposase-like protein
MQVSSLGTFLHGSAAGRHCQGSVGRAVQALSGFSLSLRDVELILAARGIVVSYESIRE